MNLFLLSWKNLIAKPLSAGMSLLLLALGVSIISLLLLLNERLDTNFKRNLQGIDMVVGAKGSPLQLILASVYHIDNPTGNIPLSEAEGLMNHPLVKKAIPLAYGDNYQGYRILGTDTSYLSHYDLSLERGELWGEAFEVVAGGTVAERLGLEIGTEFFSAHGLSDANNQHDTHAFKVVGILQSNGTVADQLLMTAVESIWDIHADHGPKDPAMAAAEIDDHDHEGEDHDHDHDHEGEDHDHAHEEGEGAHEHTEDQEITALLIEFRNKGMGLVMLPRMINEQTSMQAALPAIEINKLLTKLLPIAINTARGIAIAIIVISAISVFISLYNSLKARQYELALMRTMGSSRWLLFWMVVFEGLILAGLGLLLGLLASRLGLWLLNQLVVSDYHYDFGGWALLPAEGGLALLTLLIGFVAAALPGLQAFRLNISRTLAEG